MKLGQRLSEHPTGLTLALVTALCVVLSLLPLPSWLQPLDFLQAEDREKAFLDIVFRRAASTPGGGGAHGEIADITDAEGPSEDPMKEEVVPLAPKARGKWTPPARPKYEETRRAVKADPVPVVIPCVEQGPKDCARYALDRFFARLADAEHGKDGATVRVVHFGDSLIASDHITDLVRQRLHERFGSGGRGMLLIDRLSRLAGRRVRTGNATGDWSLDVITMAKPKDGYFGYTGASFTANKDGEASEFDVGPNRFVEIHHLAYPEGGVLEVEVDGKVAKSIDMRAPTAESRIERLQLPEGTKSMRLVAKQKGPRIYGVSLEAGVPGVVYESLGLPGATSKVWNIPDEATFAKHLSARDPALLVTMLGGNDGLMLSKKRTTIEEIEQSTTAFMERLRRAAPGTDCLIVSPMDAARTKVGGEMTSKPEVREVIAVQKRIAEKQGCAFWDMWSSMGGDGSLERWWNEKMINPDMIHPRGYGGDLLGELMVTALMEAYDRPRSTEAPVVAAKKPVEIPPVLVVDPIEIRLGDEGPPPDAPNLAKAGALEDPGRRTLARFFDRLRALEGAKGQAGSPEAARMRAAVSVFGSTHVASVALTDALRARLTPRFGDRGRGFVPAGSYSKALGASGAERLLKGSFDLVEGRDVPERATLFGMSGVRAELRQGARFVFAPCTKCPADVGASVFDLFFLSAPGMAWGKVNVSEVPQQLIGRAPGQRELAVKRFASDSPRPRLDLEVEGPGTFVLFGVAHELDRPGVVVEPVALPGATPAMMLRWDQDVVMGMLARRRSDLVIVAYGEVEAQEEAIDVPSYRRELARLLRRLRTASDEAACLVVGPAPSLERRGSEWVELASVAEIERLQREAARAEGCAFWATRAAIGGPRGLAKWAEEPGKVSEDRRTLEDGGLAALGALLAADLIDDYDAYLGTRAAN